MTAVAIIVVLILAAIAGAVAYGAIRNSRAFAKQNEIVAGTPSRAPAAWAGAHTPEARLHRRLGVAVQAAQAQAAARPGFGDVAAAIARSAQEIDDQLIAASALPAQHRDKAIADLEPSVVALENAAAGQGSAALAGDTAVTAALAEAHERLDALAEARAEIDEVDLTQRRTQPETQPATQSPKQQETQPATQPPARADPPSPPAGAAP